MMLDNIEIEKNIRKLKENFNKNKKFSYKKKFIKDIRIWTQKTNAYINNIIFDINRKDKFIQKEKLLLNEIEDINSDDINNLNNIKNQLEKKKKKEEEKPVKVYKGITSENYANLLKKAYNKINQIIEESKEMQKINGRSLQKISSKYYRTSRPKSASIPKQKIFKKARPASASTYFESKILLINNNNKSNINNNRIKYKTINSSHRSFRDGLKFQQRKLNSNKIDDEKKLMDLRYVNLDKIYKENNKRFVNLARLNDVYRVQLNKALNMFSAKRHLKDMKQIQIEDRDVRQEIFDINRQIDEKINERCQGLYFKREYEKYISKNKRNVMKSKSSKSMNNSYNKNKQIGSFRTRANYSSRNLFDPKVHNRFKEDLDNEKKRKISQREKMEKKKESLKEILEQIGETLDIEPIHKYINDESKLNRKKGIKKDMFEIQKEYFPKFEEINKNIKIVISQEEEKKIEKDELEYCLIKAQDMLSKEIAHNNASQKFDS